MLESQCNFSTEFEQRIKLNLVQSKGENRNENSFLKTPSVMKTMKKVNILQNLDITF